MPQKIAIPGGTGTIGSSLVSALHNNPKYIPIILSRATSANPPNTTSIYTASLHPEKQVETKTEIRYVDYTSVASLTASLSDIHTVVSTLLIPGPELVSYQLNLLSAAIAAGCKRFAPSEFALPQHSHGDVDVDHGKIIVWGKVKDAVAKGQIDGAAFPCGMFMNYLAIGAPRELEGRAGFREGELIFHLRGQHHRHEHRDNADGDGGWIEVPLSDEGEYPKLTMTDIRDVGRFIVAALEMEEPWGGRELGMAGDTRSFDEISPLIERILGRKVQVKTVGRRELQERLDRLDSGDILGRIDVQYMMVCGKGGSVVEGRLNELCREVRPTMIEEFLERYWG
ncbi:hypothetical protein BDW72DRAFT_186830 [Aspergillus terricola var. indicus]